MIHIENFQVRGLSGYVKKVRFGDRVVDYWAPSAPSSHILVSHDGQNVLDKRNIPINPHQRATWRLAQSASRVAESHGLVPPTVICIYHTPFLKDKWGRVKELTPQKYMDDEKYWVNPSYGVFDQNDKGFVRDLSADDLIAAICEKIVPSIASTLNQEIEPANTAIVGASMGGLASIYSVIKRPDFFHTSLSFSPHWVIGGNTLAAKMMADFPSPGSHKLWMSRGSKGLDALYEDSQDLANSLIRNRGYRESVNLKTMTIKRGAHTNATWARYVPAALDFWLEKGKK